MRGGGRFSRYQLKSTQEVEDGLGDTRENPKIPNIPKLQKLDWDVAPPQEYFDELMRISKNQIIWGGNYFYLPPTRCFLVWRKLSISESFTMAMAESWWLAWKEYSETSFQQKK